MPSTSTSSASPSSPSAAAAAAASAASADLAAALTSLRAAAALLVEHAREKKNSGKKSFDPSYLRQLATSGALSLLRLKAALRAAAEAADLARTQASSARARADAAALAVASLAYEARHFDREIQAARDYASAFSEEEVDLVSLDEFWAQAPAELREGKDDEGIDEATAAARKHALTLARLEHERASRVKGAAEARDAKAACEAAEADAARARLELAELGDRVSAVVAALEAALPATPAAVEAPQAPAEAEDAAPEDAAAPVAAAT